MRLVFETDRRSAHAQIGMLCERQGVAAVPARRERPVGTPVKHENEVVRLRVRPQARNASAPGAEVAADIVLEHDIDDSEAPAALQPIGELAIEALLMFAARAHFADREANI